MFKVYWDQTRLYPNLESIPQGQPHRCGVARSSGRGRESACLAVKMQWHLGTSSCSPDWNRSSMMNYGNLWWVSGINMDIYELLWTIIHFLPVLDCWTVYSHGIGHIRPSSVWRCFANKIVWHRQNRLRWRTEARVRWAPSKCARGSYGIRIEDGWSRTVQYAAVSFHWCSAIFFPILSP